MTIPVEDVERHVVTADAALDAARKARAARAERYFSEDLRDQRGWYSRKASANKEWAQRLGLAVIACGAVITFLQIFAAALWVAYATAVLGVLVALIEGAQRIWKFDETWRGYRAASERMKRELRLYVNAAGNYTPISDEDDAYRAFVTAIEQIIAEEQQIYWQARTKTAETASPQAPGSRREGTSAPDNGGHAARPPRTGETS